MKDRALRRKGDPDYTVTKWSRKGSWLWDTIAAGRKQAIGLAQRRLDRGKSGLGIDPGNHEAHGRGEASIRYHSETPR